jgi:hypothetical protein
MAFTIRRVDYFYTVVDDKPGEAYQLLSQLADLGINLLAFTGVPIGPMRTQLTIVPEETPKLNDAARRSGLILDGPHPAFLVQGDDEFGALAKIHMKLFQAEVNVYAGSGVANGRGSFGYLLYVRPEHLEKAASSLGI